MTPLVHIGFPKCASTFLQNSVFPRTPELYVGDRWTRLGFDRFVLTDAADFDPASVAATFAPPPGAEHRVPVISNENFVGGAVARYDWLVPTAERFARTFPEARVVMVVREQRSMVLSLYRQLVKRGQSLRLDTAIAPRGAPGYYPPIRVERLRYHLAHEEYVARFGADRVLVLPFEHLTRDADGFLGELLRFAVGRPVTLPAWELERENVGYRGLTLEARRLMNRVSAENYTGPGGAPRSYKLAGKATRAVDELLPDSAHTRREAAYRATVAEVVGESFVESNRLLAERTGLDLAALGYMT